MQREMYRRFDGPIDDILMQPREDRAPAVVEDFHIDHEAVKGIDTETRAEPVPEFNIPEPEPEPEIEDPQPVFTFVDETINADDEVPFSAETEPEPDPEPELPPELPLPANVDPLVDEIAILTCGQAVSGSAIRDALQPLPSFQKPVRWLGRDDAGQFLLLTKDQEQTQFSAVIATLQLADRSGPASGEDLRNFHAKVEDLAMRLGGGVQWREHGDPLQYAKELDQFCIEVDVMISLHIATGSGGPFAGTKLRGLAEASGMVLKEDGQFHYPNEAGETLFTLSSHDRRPFTAEMLRTAMLPAVMLMMDVPRVENGAEAFNQMVQLGRKLELSLSAKLMDENQRPLGDAEIDLIRQQLKIIYSKMHARNVAPGGTTALRLFS